jgi:hypothetical protein
MDSVDSISRGRMSWMPTLAIFMYELRGLLTSWLVRGWFIVTALITLLVAAGAWQEADPAPLIAALLFSYLVFPWFLIVIMLGISPTTGNRLDALADGILCRPVTRHEYLLACWGARVAIVLGVYLAVMLPAISVLTFAKRTSEQPVTFYGATMALGVVALVLTFLVTLSFLAGTAMRRPFVAAMTLVFVWVPLNLVLHAFSLEEFSPISLSQALPTLLRTPWTEVAEEESDSELSTAEMEALARQADQFMSILSGGTPPPSREAGFFEKGDYQDFSVWRVGLGYGIPTLLALVLSAAFFGWRDL